MPSTRKQPKAKARRSREADLLSDLENMDVMLGSLHLDEIDIENRSVSKNSEAREGSSNENEYRTYNRATSREGFIVSETLEKKLQTIASEMNMRLS